MSSWSKGLLNIRDFRGCSQCKSRLAATWCLSNTIPMAIWYRWSSRWLWIFWNISIDLLSFKTLQEHHGPHVGLSHICLGLWMTIVSNNFRRPSEVERSPWSKPNRTALPLSCMVWRVSSLLGPQKTSTRCNGFPCFWFWCCVTRSSVSNLLINSCNWTLNFCCWVQVNKTSSHSSL